MDTATMRRIDRWLGRPMCVAATVVRRITDPIRRRPPAAPRRLLVVKLAEQGAWVVAAPALARATELVGRDGLYVITFAENRGVLDEMDLVPPDHIVTVRTDGALVTLRDLISALRRLRRIGIDASVDFEFFARSSALVSFLSGATRRAGFHAAGNEASYRGDLLTHRLVYNPRLHVADVYRCVVEALVVEPDRLPVMELPEAPVSVAVARAATPTEVGTVETIVRDAAGFATDRPLPRLVLLNANAGDLLPLRRWPDDRYVEVARRLLDRHDDVLIAFTGSPAEADAAAALAARVGSDRAISLGGRTTMRELLVLYGIAEVLVTNDSGPAHYAALTSVDVVTLFGPESPHVFGARTPRNHVLWAALPCSPCVNAFNDRVTPCRDNVCMQRITVDQVLETVDAALSGRAQPAG